MTTIVAPTGEPEPSEVDRVVQHATKLFRVASAILAVNDELSAMPVRAGPARHLARLHRRLLVELASALSDEGQQELAVLVRVLDESVASEAAVRFEFAQLAGWVLGLVGGPTWEHVFVLAAPKAAA